MIEKPQRFVLGDPLFLHSKICELIDEVNNINLIIEPMKAKREAEIAKFNEKQAKADAEKQAELDKALKIEKAKKIVAEAEARKKAEAEAKAKAEAKAEAEAKALADAKKLLKEIEK